MGDVSFPGLAVLAWGDARDEAGGAKFSDRAQPCAAGDAEDFDRLVASAYGDVARFVQRLLGWRRDADDVVQEVFLAAWRNWRRFRGDAPADVWLRRIAVNQCRRRMRWQTVRDRWLRWRRDTPPTEAVESPNVAALTERAQAVQAAVAALPTREREVIVLHYLEQYDIDAVAELLGMRRNTVDVRLHRGRQRLAKTLGPLFEP